MINLIKNELTKIFRKKSIYILLAIMLAFITMYLLTKSNINMRADLNKYFYDYLFNNVIIPYLSFYKIQVFLILTLMIASIFENKYKKKHGEYEFQTFENENSLHSKFFITGLVMNLLPMYLFTMFILAKVVKYFNFMVQ